MGSLETPTTPPLDSRQTVPSSRFSKKELKHMAQELIREVAVIVYSYRNRMNADLQWTLTDRARKLDRLVSEKTFNTTTVSNEVNELDELLD